MLENSNFLFSLISNIFKANLLDIQMKKIYIVGMGPGKYDQMTIEAVKKIEESDVVIGYTVYTDLIKEIWPDKNCLSTPMTKEYDRCVLAFEEANKGKTVALVCSGDAGVYGLSGLMLGIAPQYSQVEVKTVAGVTAALSGAALIGAPLIHDFAVISLSDLLTPWEKIEKRLECAAIGDFCICLYNPGSKKRADYLEKACEILLKYKIRYINSLIKLILPFVHLFELHNHNPSLLLYLLEL